MRKRSKFSLSHYRLFSAKMGQLLPIGLTEVLPGDTFQHSTSLFLRCAPMVTPVMHPVHTIIHHWFIPSRLLWDSWEDFITGGPDGMDASIMPTIKAPDADGFAVGSLADYLGVPTGIPGLEVMALPFRAYALLYNECYRDQDLETPLDISLDDGPDTTTSTELQRTDWARDYFTTARPWPQKGPQVTVPVNGSEASFNIVAESGATGSQQLKLGTYVQAMNSSGTKYGEKQFVSGELRVNNAIDTGPAPTPIYPSSPTQATSAAYWTSDPLPNVSTVDPRATVWGTTANSLNFPAGVISGLKVQSSGQGDIGTIDINQLREAFALQRFEEHRALYGSRYVEYLRYLGVKSSDARLQRPEYLGGSKQTVQFSEVLQTGTDAAADTPVGTLRGHGIAASRTNRYRRFFEEHGFVISVMTVRPVSVYMQGLPRLWNRRVKEDYFQRELQHIGQQEVLTKELYAGDTNGPTADDVVWGYQNRYDEYRAHESYVSGEFRTVLDSWHMARNFANQPTLNADFISALPTDRIFASQINDTLYCMAHHSIQARRIIAKHGNPI